MARLLAEDLLLLCWDTERCRTHSACAPTLAGGVGAALLIDALQFNVLTVDHGRVHATGFGIDDPLLVEAAETAQGWPPPTVEGTVGRLGIWDRLARVRGRLVDAGVLRVERKRLLGLLPVTRHPVADPDGVAGLRHEVRAVLTGRALPAQASRHTVMLAVLAEPVDAIWLLVDPFERGAARQRARALAEEHGVPEDLTDAVRHSRVLVGGG